MKRETRSPQNILDRFFAQVLKPSSEQMDRSRRNIMQHLQAGPRDCDAIPSFQKQRWRFRSVAAFAAGVIAVAGATAILRHDQRLSETTVAAASDGSRYRFGETVQTKGKAGVFLQLADNSRVEMRKDSELSLESAGDGVRIRLKTGGVIVSAAKQREGHLYVQTKDVVVSVVGTVFLVDADWEGSRVAVIQGEVRVQQGGVEKKLHPGEQVATKPRMDVTPMTEEVLSWSRDAESHLALLAQSVTPSRQPAIALPSVPQASDTPKWEAVAIRPCNEDSVPRTPGGRGAGPRLSIGRITFECMTVQQMITLAYDRLGERVLNAAGRSPSDPDILRGGPPWVRRDKYRIDAKAEGTPDSKVMMGPMLRVILEDRFQLKLRRETEEVPMYALTVGKSGLKIRPLGIQPVGADGCRQRTPEDTFTYEQVLAHIRAGEKPYCGVSGGSEGPNIIWDFGGSTLANFAGILSGNLDRHVLDKTGIEGRFNIHLEFIRDENTSPHFGDPVEQPEISPGASIFTAVESLGLKLEATKGPRGYLVIDVIERPSEN